MLLARLMSWIRQQQDDLTHLAVLRGWLCHRVSVRCLMAGRSQRLVTLRSGLVLLFTQRRVCC